MGWVWVKELKNKATGQVMQLIVPPVPYTGWQGLQAYEYQRYNTSHPEYETYVKDIASQERNPSVSGSDKVGMTYGFPGNGGGFTITQVRRESNNIPRNITTWYIKDLWGTTILGATSTGCIDAPYGNYRTDYVTCAFVCVLNDETQQMYFGFIDSCHTTDVSDPWYYSWRFNIYIYSHNWTNNNAYRIFRSQVPSGGGEGPYHTDDYDEPIQGDPSYDDSTDTVENPALPVITANASGFVTAFVPSIGEINALANYMISPSFIQALGQTALGGFKDMILGLQVFPCTIEAETPTNLYLYYPGVAVSSGVQMGKASNQFVEIDCGDLEVEEYWGNCCDYNPYTKIGIFLPFCGFYDLDTDDVMGKTLNVSYRVDIMSGACLATIKVDGSVMYQYSGTCSAQIPLNSSSYDEFFKSMIELGTATATGGAGLLAAGASYNTALERSVNMSDKNSYMANAMMDEADAHYDMAKVNTASSLANSTVSNIIGSKAIYKHAGALGSSVGFLGVRKPYLIIKRPYQQIPDMYGKFHGYPCFTKANLNDLTGYTVVDDIRLNIPDATVDEILECEKLLKEGVVL